MALGSVYARGWVPHTCIAVSSTIRITAADSSGTKKQIGLIQSFKPSDSRKLERARGVGYGDRVAEIVPATTDVQIQCSRMCLYEKNVLDCFGYKTMYNKGANNGAVRTLAHMKNPFDIEEMILHHNNGNPTTLTVYNDCWISEWSRSIEITGNLILLEDVTIWVTWVSDGTEPDAYASTDGLALHGMDSTQNSGSTLGKFNAGGLEGMPGGGNIPYGT